MVSYVLNVRIDQLDADVGALHLPGSVYVPPRRLPDTRFCSSRHGMKTRRAIMAPQTIGQAVPDQSDKRYYWLPTHRRRPLERPVTLRELHAVGITSSPSIPMADPFGRCLNQSCEDLSRWE